MRHMDGSYEPPRRKNLEETPLGFVLGVSLVLWACMIGLFFYIALG